MDENESGSEEQSEENSESAAHDSNQIFRSEEVGVAETPLPAAVVQYSEGGQGSESVQQSR